MCGRGRNYVAGTVRNTGFLDKKKREEEVQTDRQINREGKEQLQQIDTQMT